MKTFASLDPTKKKSVTKKNLEPTQSVLILNESHPYPYPNPNLTL